ncbi:hypothetical protein [Streptomyces narbonensis]|uniref:hypothetical protein n=1 Tax=Streptomyces narbonensis TaxID=67333 RepID=UPI003F53EA83
MNSDGRNDLVDFDGLNDFVYPGTGNWKRPLESRWELGSVLYELNLPTAAWVPASLGKDVTVLVEGSAAVSPSPTVNRIGWHQPLNPVPHRISDHQPNRHALSTDKRNKETRSRGRPVGQGKRSGENGCAVLADRL